MSTAMNFRLKRLQFESIMAIQKNVGNIDLGDQPSVPGFYTEFVSSYATLTSQVFKYRLNWYIREPVKDKRPDYYIQPFTEKIWIYLLLTLMTGSFIAISVSSFLDVTSDIKERKFNPKDHIFMPADYICNQESAKPEATIPSRIVSFSLRFLCLFIFGSYSAKITSFSAVQIINPPFRNVDEFIENGKYTAGFLKELEAGFAEVTPNLKAFKQKAFFTSNMTELAEKLCKENFAIGLDESHIEDPIVKNNIHCQYYQIENPLWVIDAVTSLSKHSQYKKIFNFLLITFYSSGLRQKMQKSYLESIVVHKEDAVDFYNVEFKQIVQILTIFATGVFISVVILISEILFPILKLKIRKLKEHRK